MKRHIGTQTSARGKTPREVTTIASDVFSEAEAAAYLHQKPRTIREWRATRGLPCFKPTAKVTLYRKADLDAWLEHSALRCHPAPVALRPPCRRRVQAAKPPRAATKVWRNENPAMLH